MLQEGPSCFQTPIAHYRESDAQWQSLLAHLRGAGMLSRRFAGKIGLRTLGELIGLLHDLGKYSHEFQSYLLSAVGALRPDLDDDYVDADKKKGKVDHATAGAQWLSQALRSDTNPVANVVAQMGALCIASHHSGLIDCISPDGEDTFSRRMAKDAKATHLPEVTEALPPKLLKRLEALIASPALLAEVDTLFRSIASRHQPDCRIPYVQQQGLAARFLFSCLIAADRIDTAHFQTPTGVRFRQGGRYPHWQKLIDRLEQHLASFPARYPIDRIRREISDACLAAASRPRGIYSLTVPTGGGKTLAGLRFALHHAAQRKLDRIIVIIPFTSIIDQNAAVARDILEPEGARDDDARRVVLEHHSNLTPEAQTSREKVLCEDWDAPVVYTTMVQFLETLFGGGTRSVRRLHQLANAVLIFDEVQTLPVRCVHLFNNALEFLVNEANSTAVLCTATQPLLDTVDVKKGALRPLAGQELMPDAPGLFRDLRRVEVEDVRKPGGWSDEAVAGLAVQSVEQHGSCLVIVNTKRAAERVYAMAAAQLDEACVRHLSTAMCPAHRKAELQGIRQDLADDKPVLCVSTQLIEAGVDVDFQVVVRFLAGLDSIAQAAGRCNRHGRAEQGLLYIVNRKSESLAMLPDIDIGRAQAEVVLDRFRSDPERYDGDCLGLQALREYYDLYFHQRAADMSYPIARSQLSYDSSLLQLASANDQAVLAFQAKHGKPPPLHLRQSFKTAAQHFRAIDSPTESVIVPYGDDGHALWLDLIGMFGDARERVWDMKAAGALLKHAQQYTVNVFPHLLRRLIDQKAVTLLSEDLRVYCLDSTHYSHRFGLSGEVVNFNEVPMW